ncbi:MAG: hypothetical protein R3D67_16520 [Hyphomicrobiaceae bacterium]
MDGSSLIALGGAQWLALALIMACAWLVQQRTGNSGWVDAFWTFGTGLVAAGSGRTGHDRRLGVLAAMAGGGARIGMGSPARQLHRRFHAWFG